MSGSGVNVMSPPVEVAGEVAITVSMLGGLIVGIFMFGRPVGIFGRPVGIGMFVGIDPQALNNSPARIRRVNKIILIFMEPLLLTLARNIHPSSSGWRHRMMECSSLLYNDELYSVLLLAPFA
jgi:hypothetical protein